MSAETVLATIDNDPAVLALFGNGSEEVAVPTSGKMTWLKFYSESSKEGVSGKCKAAGVKVNTFYLEDQLGVRALDHCRVHVVKLFRFNGKIDQKGAVIATRDADYRCPEKPKKFKQGVLALFLVQTPGGLQVACGQYLSSLCRAFQGYEGVVKDCSNADVLAKRGGVWDAASYAVVPEGRFTLSLSGYAEATDNGPTFIGHREVHASSAAEVDDFNALVTYARGVLFDAVAYFAKIADKLKKMDETKYDKDGNAR